MLVLLVVALDEHQLRPGSLKDYLNRQEKSKFGAMK